MIILVDIGNSAITTGFSDRKITHLMRLKTPLYRQYIKKLSRHIVRYKIETPDAAIISSVVPEAGAWCRKSLQEGFGVMPLMVSHRLNTGLRFSIKKPSGLGADRIANAVAAYHLYRGNIIVVDFGTATTFCLITSDGEFKGGAIMPGLEMSARSLFQHTAKLPRVRLKSPESVIGTDTNNSIISGIIFGHAGAVERIIKQIKQEFSCNTGYRRIKALKIIATGGFAGMVTPYINGINIVDNMLTLKGLRIIYELNKGHFKHLKK
jgi:type III pantothenate kinase